MRWFQACAFPPVLLSKSFLFRIEPLCRVAQLIDGFGQVDRRLSRDNVGDPFLPEYGQVVSGRSFAEDVDKMIAVEITARPP